MDRRSFLAAAAGMPLATSLLDAQQRPFPIIDTHIHLYDPSRPQGVPWPSKNDKIMYRTVLPANYREVAYPLGIKGAIETECSPLVEDNQWVLDVCEKDTIMVGTVGNLEPGKPEFAQQLERFHKNPLFRGIRYGNLWNRNIHAELAKQEFIDGLKLLANAGLSLDTANPNANLLADVVTISDKVPELRVIVDHLPNYSAPAEGPMRQTYDTALRELRTRPQVYVKISEVLKRVNGQVSYELADHKAKLDELFDVFGPDRVLYGSDWPNSDPLGTYPQVLNVVWEYFTAKGNDVAERYFWKNSVKAYRWKKRSAEQPEGA